MLTVKVTKTSRNTNGELMTGLFSTKIVEAVEVNIHILRPGPDNPHSPWLYEVSGVGKLSGNTDGGDNSFAFYVADQSKPRPEGFADCIDFWNSAYIENSAGKTTEVVRF